MKEKYRSKLQEDFDKYAKQMGILEEEMPQLVMDRPTMWKILQDNGKSKRAAGYGECFWDLKTIFVDTHIRVAQYRVYPMYVKVAGLPYRVKRTGQKKKITYKDMRKTLVHELVHYRFRYMRHGVKFEQKIKEILSCKVFPAQKLYDNNTNT